MNKKITITILVLALIGVSIGLAVVEPWRRSGEIPGLAARPTGGDFILQGSHGEFRLIDYRDKVVVVYFGYTFCPDICPTNLALITQALNEMEADELNRVQPLFISVDPQRDTLDRLKAYVGYFHPRFLGITGTAEQVKSVAHAYGAAYAKVEKVSAGGYLVDHSSETYVIAPDGSLFTKLHHAAPPTDILKQIRLALSSQSR